MPDTADQLPDGGPVRSLLTLPTDVPDQLRAFYDEHRILERAARFPGCLSAEWWAPTGGGDPVISALWTDADRYQAWTAEPWRGELSAAMSRLLRSEAFPIAELYLVSTPPLSA